MGGSVNATTGKFTGITATKLGDVAGEGLADAGRCAEEENYPKARRTDDAKLKIVNLSN